jgi:AcrR family transcriptional regulator
MARPSRNDGDGGSARDALIRAAIELFGRDGYAAVSTRMLSERAGTNIASIKYYFGSKDDLYRAAVEHVVETLRPRLELALDGFAQGQELAGDDPALQARLLKRLIANLMGLFLGSDEVPVFMPLVLREFFMPGPHFETFYQALPRRLHELFTSAVAMVRGTDPDDEATILQAHALIGQIMIFHVGRPILFRRMDWQSFDPGRIDAIVTTVQASVLRSLDLEDPDHGR